MPDPILSLFEEFRDGQMTRIQECLSTHEEENEILDFKTNVKEVGSGAAKKVIPHGNLEPQTKRVLSKAISAFANNAGGVLVWGIEDKVGGRTTDRAEISVPIPNVEGFVAELKREAGKLVTPPLPEMQHAAIVMDENGSGFAVTYIPNGKVKPHMGKAPDQHTYYLRTGPRSETMPDSTVRAYVIAGAVPDVDLVCTVDNKKYRTASPHYPNQPEEIEAYFNFNLVNKGTVNATNCAFAVEKVAGFGNSSHSARAVKVNLENDIYQAFMMTHGSAVLYPGTEERISHVQYKTQAIDTEGRTATPKGDVECRYVVYADHYVRHGIIVIPKEGLEVTF